MNDPIVGIDLGTSNTVVAYADSMGNTTVLADDAGYKIHPSVVSFHPSGGVVVGAAAKQRKVIDPANTVFSAKRLIGRRFQSNEVQIAMKRMPYEIIEGDNHLPKIVTRAGEFAVPEISAIILDHVKEVATQRLQQDVSRAVITVPASFNDAQRSATANAGAVAGLTVMRVLNEPTAAALAYGNSRNLRQTIVVYDFGGGTFDVTVLKLDNEVYEVLGTAGDNFLGGDDLDEKLVDRMCLKFLKDTRIDLKNNEISMMRLRAVAEQTKIELSRRSRAVVRIDEIAYGPKGAPLNLQIEISRDEFVGEVGALIDRTFPVCQEAMILAGLDIDRIDDIILVGGTTKIPYVRDQVSRFFNKAPRTDIAPEEAVAVGAALQATALDRILSKSGRISAQTPSQSARMSSQIPVETETTNTGVMQAPKEITRTAVGAEALRPEVTGVASDSARYEATGIAPDSARYEATGVAPDALRPETTETGYGEPPRAPAYATPQSRTLVADLEGNAPRGEYKVKRPTSDVIPTQRPQVPVGRMASRNMPAQPPPSPPPRQPPPSTAPGMAAQPPPTPGVARIRPNQPSQPLPRDPSVAARPTVAVQVDGPRRLEAPDPPPPRPAPGAPFSPQAAAPTMVAQQPLPTRQHPASVPPPQARPHTPSVPPPQTFQPNPISVSAPLPLPPAPAPISAQMPIAQPPVVRPPEPARPTPVVLDVLPRGLGIGTVAGYCEELIRRNSRIPAQMRKTFTTIRDNQDVVQIVVCQGESRRIDDNVVLGDLRLEGLPKRPRGETSIEVTFEMDASGILNVRARDVLTNMEQRASLDVVGTLPAEDIAGAQERLKRLTR